jgi:iron complex transport system substrate-binding protein
LPRGWAKKIGCDPPRLLAGFIFMVKKIIVIVSIVIVALLFLYKHSISSEKRLRIISLAPSTTEILFALGLDKEIMGVSQFCNYPKEAQSKERIGTFSEPNIERILSLKPDIIFCTGLEQIVIIEKLRQLNLNMCISDPSDIKGLFDSIEEIGELTDKKDAAQILIRKMKADIESVTLITKKIPENNRLKVFVEIWHDPLMTVGNSSFVDELIRLAGGINIANDTKRPYSVFSPEEVIRRNPDCIILAYMDQPGGPDIVKSRLGWRDISAVKNNRIYNDINPDLFLRPGPRVTEGLKEIYKRLYP